MNYIYQLSLLWLSFCELSYAAIYTDTWALHIQGGKEKAKFIAEKHGFTFLNEIMPDYYHIRHKRVAKRSIYSSEHRHETIAKESEVKWIEQQVAKKRVKRDLNYNDPKWPRMWYLSGGALGGLDMNVKPAWDKGFTGKGVVVSILDDGIERDHPDLKQNYDPDASYDVNSHDRDPQPRYDYTNENRHGTRCAGEVAAAANNGICSVGVAYDASIGGVRMLDGDVTDAVEATSLSLNPQHIQIYSASWGPDDDGRTVDGPGNLAKKAFKDGIERGRNGLGSIFVWASGNGGRDGDSCNCDGYTNSIYTLSISSATEHARVPWYSEACSSTLATTYSSGGGSEKQIVTTDLRKSCTENHTGTSASAPLAAGICALALDANPHLTWRDMQHIVVRTARPANLNAPDWVTNGVGRRVSHSYGYGVMDASGMVDLALNWTTVPPQHVCPVTARNVERGITVNGRLEVTLDTDGCENNYQHKVKYLEHVQVLITLSSSRRGEVKIYLKSPQGTKSTLLPKRSRDTSTEGFNNWAFMTTHSWGEQAAGRWTLIVENGAAQSTLKGWSLRMYGTDDNPQNLKHTPSYEEFTCEPNKYELNKFCYDKCPPSFYGTNTSATNSKGEKKEVKRCEPCHDECMQCTGPASNECLACASGFDLSNKTCIPSLDITKIKQEDHPMKTPHNDKYLIMSVGAICLSAIFVFIIVFGLLQCRDKQMCCQKHLPPDGIQVEVPTTVEYKNGKVSSEQKQALLETDTEDELWDGKDPYHD